MPITKVPEAAATFVDRNNPRLSHSGNLVRLLRPPACSTRSLTNDLTSVTNAINAIGSRRVAAPMQPMGSRRPARNYSDRGSASMRRASSCSSPMDFLTIRNVRAVRAILEPVQRPWAPYRGEDGGSNVIVDLHHWPGRARRLGPPAERRRSYRRRFVLGARLERPDGHLCDDFREDPATPGPVARARPGPGPDRRMLMGRLERLSLVGGRPDRGPVGRAGGVHDALKGRRAALRPGRGRPAGADRGRERGARSRRALSRSRAAGARGRTTQRGARGHGARGSGQRMWPTPTGKITLVELYPGEIILAPRLVDPNVILGGRAAGAGSGGGRCPDGLPGRDLMSRTGVLKPGDHVDLLFSLAFPPTVRWRGRRRQPDLQKRPMVEVRARRRKRPLSISCRTSRSPHRHRESDRRRHAEHRAQGHPADREPQDALVLKHVKDSDGVLDVVVRAPGNERPSEAGPVDFDYVINRYRSLSAPAADPKGRRDAVTEA